MMSLEGAELIEPKSMDAIGALMAKRSGSSTLHETMAVMSETVTTIKIFRIKPRASNKRAGD
jgi:hypothetical protein